MRTVTAIVTGEKVNVTFEGCADEDMESAAIAVLVAAVTCLSERYDAGRRRRVAVEEIGARLARIAGEGLEKVVAS